MAGKPTIEVLPKPLSSRQASLDGVHKRVKGSLLTATKTYVPVIGMDRKPLMPTTPSRVARWIKSGKATPFWSKGVFCVRLNVKTGTEKQSIAIGIDPGSKMEGITLKSEAHTFLNIQAKAVTWVKDAVEVKRNMRRARRFRKTPCRQNRQNRARGCLSPSTKARWQWKLRLVNWLCKMFPVECFVVEDVKAVTKKNCKKWNKLFSPLETGKNWFYEELSKLGRVELLSGWDTYELRNSMGLKKTGNKMQAVFSSHCVDSWVLANYFVGGHTKPDNERLLMIVPLQFHRRQLHVMNPIKGGIRKSYGSTGSLGFKRGSLVRHPKHGVTYVGGTWRERISLHSLESGKRLCQNAKSEDCKFLTFNSWRTAILLPDKADSYIAE